MASPPNKKRKTHPSGNEEHQATAHAPRYGKRLVLCSPWRAFVERYPLPDSLEPPSAPVPEIGPPSQAEWTPEPPPADDARQPVAVAIRPSKDRPDVVLDLTSFCPPAGSPKFLLPGEAKAVVWQDGTATKLPWLPKPDNAKQNLLADLAFHVKKLAEMAKPSTDAPWIVHLKRSDFASDFELGRRIRSELARGFPVILKGYPYDHVDLTAKDLEEKLNLAVNQVQCVHDSAERMIDFTYPHVEMTLEDFISGVEDNGRIQCILDCPTMDGSKPNLIKYIDDGSAAWMRLHWEAHDRRLIPIDVQKSTSWLIMHQALFHTFSHHDADGFGTWTQVLSGYKLWAFVKHRNLDGCRTFQEYRDAVVDYSNQTRGPHGYYGSESDRFVVTAGPGDLIIQPPGIFHEVYTPVPSVTLGGHFYSYDAAHLTELTRSFGFQTNGSLTNQSHDSALFTLEMMVLALPKIEGRGSKSIAALCRMILRPRQYTAAPALDPDVLMAIEDAAAKRKSGKEYSVTTARAKSLANNIVQGLGLPQHARRGKKAKAQDEGDYLFDDGRWSDPGDVVDLGPILRP
ncbi:unnamed protein product [Cyclocybe aegerita]|uniref:JmjC domain-containing protein n=1 Tax=Cyclocybe aegerita TaxID=1973307 RepID=A0A8S0VWW7_CYCAE|nr:unnamed protein product [Cyclocybe aegerita]